MNKTNDSTVFVVAGLTSRKSLADSTEKGRRLPYLETLALVDRFNQGSMRENNERCQQAEQCSSHVVGTKRWFEYLFH
jgi:hypothetical protein